MINSATRPGTNSFHGSLYEFLRNNALDARNFFELKSAAPFRRNQFGASVGGPVKRDKAFFFFNYEGLRQHLDQTFQAFVPTLAARAQAVPSVKPIVDLYPAPTSDLGDGIGTLITVGGQTAEENYYLGRFDYNLSSNDSLFARYVSDIGTLGKSILHHPGTPYLLAKPAQRFWIRLHQAQYDRVAAEHVRTIAAGLSRPAGRHDFSERLVLAWGELRQSVSLSAKQIHRHR